LFGGRLVEQLDVVVRRLLGKGVQVLGLAPRDGDAVERSRFSITRPVEGKYTIRRGYTSPTSSAAILKPSSLRNSRAKAMFFAPMSVITGNIFPPPNIFTSSRSRRAPSFISSLIKLSMAYEP
jgi:hypothetical protein